MSRAVRRANKQALPVPPAHWRDALRARFVPVALALLACACGSAPVEPQNARLAESAEYNQRGAAALKLGDYRRALAFYEAALRIDISVEHAEGVAINSINLARVHQLAGEPARAHERLDALLADRLTPAAPQYVAAARLRKALLYQAAGDAGSAALMAGQAEESCKDASCPWQGSLLNLRARIALAKGEAGAALALSTQALDANRARAAHEETANSLRLQAEARIAQKEFAAALAPLAEALALDKALGLSERIELDLRQLAAAHAGAGNAEAARELRARADRLTQRDPQGK